MVVIDLPHLMYGSRWVRLKNMFHYELYIGEYRTEEEVKIKFPDIRSKVKNFIKICYDIDNELMNGDEQVIL